MNDIQTSQLVDAVANLFNVKETDDLAHRVAMQAMMLPDKVFQQLFVQLSFQMNVDSACLMKLFVDDVVMRQLWSGPASQSVTLQLKAQEHRFKLTCPRMKATAYQEFQDRFAVALKRVIETNQNLSLACQDYAELCQVANELFLHYNQMDFWKQVSLLVPERTDKQLRDYYQKSFLRNMYAECISGSDKITLCSLVDQMPSSKPSQIADRFAELVGESKYFKRNVVMYIVNRKGK
ncbi:SANT/Myb_domain [Hexamita inflata]|uniref:SANT/Myb domain n=1 Tax=Hexamita inflata TaxID=28002 RepID=A0AA86UX93_9EUKA|nr:SANT/Myb domain [Hexamita inflata]